MKLRKVGLIGRFKPLHAGGYILLEEACKQAEQVTIGIGSSNKYNLRNPFTAEESEAMINLVLENFSNYKIIKVPDFAHLSDCKDGNKWKSYIKEHFGDLDYFISGNDYVRSLLKDTYPLLHPGDIVPRERWTKLRATEVRLEMARFGNWEKLVPKVVADYLEDNGITDRFRKEFGIQTLASLVDKQDYLDENADVEKLHAGEE